MAERAHKVVSSESEELILVDADDNPLGTLSKAACHDGDGVLHRAFSLFVFNEAGELLLQRRSAEKRLWPMYWSNSCCSHPRAGETLDVAVGRRAEQELGIGCSSEFIYRFAYHARFGDLGSEREMCSVYLCRNSEELSPNPHEIAEIRFVSPGQLEAEFARSPEQFTPWFRMEWEALNREHADRLRPYLAG